MASGFIVGMPSGMYLSDGGEIKDDAESQQRRLAEEAALVQLGIPEEWVAIMDKLKENEDV